MPHPVSLLPLLPLLLHLTYASVPITRAAAQIGPSVSFIYPVAEAALGSDDNGTVLRMSGGAGSNTERLNLDTLATSVALDSGSFHDGGAASTWLNPITGVRRIVVAGGAMSSSVATIFPADVSWVTSNLFVGGAANSSRLYPAVGTLPTIGYVIIVGGENTSGALVNDMWVYNGTAVYNVSFTFGSSFAKKRMATASNGGFSTPAAIESVLVAGGLDSSGTASSLALSVRFQNQFSWSANGKAMIIPRFSACAAYSRVSQMFYIACGAVTVTNGDLIEVFNPSGETLAPELNFNLIGGARADCQCACAGNYFFLAGGRNSTGAVQANVLIYDVTIRQWVYTHNFSTDNITSPNVRGISTRNSTNGERVIFTDSQGYWIYDAQGNLLVFSSSSGITTVYPPYPLPTVPPPPTSPSESTVPPTTSPVSTLSPATTSPPSATPTPSLLPTSTVPACVGSPPFAGAVCVAGVWNVTGNVTSGGSTTVQSPIVISGSLILDPTSTIEIDTGVGSTPPLTVGGAVTLNGALVIQISSQLPSGTFVPVLSAGSVTEVRGSAGDCRHYSGAVASQGSTLGVLVNTDSSKCKSKGLSTGAIIGVAVGCAALLLVLILLVCLYLAKKHSWGPTRILFKRNVNRRQDPNFHVYT